jgi:hypothetical protein
MRQERLESLSLLMIEADLLRQINFEDLIKQRLLIRNVGENSLKCNFLKY